MFTHFKKQRSFAYIFSLTSLFPAPHLNNFFKIQISRAFRLKVIFSDSRISCSSSRASWTTATRAAPRTPAVRTCPTDGDLSSRGPFVHTGDLSYTQGTFQIGDLSYTQRTLWLKHRRLYFCMYDFIYSLLQRHEHYA
jgi:hypothetical protein